MKAKEVLDLLKITRVTLSSYVKSGKINVKRLHNGYYDYCKEDVYELAGEEPNKINVIYSRVSTYKQKDDLDVQTDKIVKYCKSKKITVKHIFSEISSGIDFERPQFKIMLNMIFERKVDTVYISFKDRLTRLSFVTLQSIFDNFGTKIIVISKEDKKDSKGDLEMFEELISLMHYFSTRMYSNRRRKKMNILKKDLGLEFLK